MNEDPTVRRNRRISELNAEGMRRFGETWGHSMSALGRAVPGGLTPEAVDSVLNSQQDHAQLFMNAGVERLLQESDDGNKESEAQYSAWRDEQRQAHRKSRGRR
jgi:hypothetical protein